MGKFIKLCAVMILFLVVTPWQVYAQSDSDPIIVNDLVGEVRFIPKTQNLMKISLIDNSDGTVHKVLYYLTPNTSDVSLSQIKEDLSSQNIELDMMNMSIAEVDNEIKEYQTNLGLFSKQLVSINIPLVNPDAVPVIGESGLELSSVTELPVLPSIVDGEIIISINFIDESGTKLYAEHFLTYYDHNTDLLKMASDKFKEKFPNYVYDLDNAYQSKNVSGDPEIIMTNLGEINAFSMEMTVPVKSDNLSKNEPISNSITSVEESESVEEKLSQSVELISDSRHHQSPHDKINQGSRASKEEKMLPSTGEIVIDNLVNIAGIIIILGMSLVGIIIIKRVKE